MKIEHFNITTGFIFTLALQHCLNIHQTQTKGKHSFQLLYSALKNIA